MHLKENRRRGQGFGLSQENIEVVRELYRLFADRQLSAAFADYADRDLELRVPAIYPDTPDVLTGRAGVERWIAMIDEAWTEWRFEPERYLDRGSKVIVIARLIAEGGSSGIHLEREVAHVWTIRAGRAASCQVYLNPEEGLEAAGLAE
jgi:ketosteroid isomerase-like protein